MGFKMTACLCFQLCISLNRAGRTRLLGRGRNRYRSSVRRVLPFRIFSDAYFSCWDGCLFSCWGLFRSRQSEMCHVSNFWHSLPGVGLTDSRELGVWRPSQGKGERVEPLSDVYKAKHCSVDCLLVFRFGSIPSGSGKFPHRGLYAKFPQNGPKRPKTAFSGIESSVFCSLNTERSPIGVFLNP